MRISFQLVGQTPLLMAADNVEAADRLAAWLAEPANRALVKPGDDRTPPWTWMNRIYSNGEHLTIPSNCLIAALRGAGAQLRLKGAKTFKASASSGIVPDSDYLKLTVAGQQIRVADLLAFQDRPFTEHVENCRKLGFDLHVRRIPVADSKHVRVRPKFDKWVVGGTAFVTAKELTFEVIKQLFDLAGTTQGLLDFRPSAKRCPGNYGIFTATVKKVEAKSAA